MDIQMARAIARFKTDATFDAWHVIRKANLVNAIASEVACVSDAAGWGEACVHRPRRRL
jgi:hypothetical protein